MHELFIKSIKFKFFRAKFLTSILQFFGLMFLTLVLLYKPSSLQSMIFYIFQDRDISRAQELINGSFIFFGPELTGGGNLPGSFYYFLLTPPLLLGLGLIGVWYWMFFLLALGGVLGWYFLRTRFGVLPSFLWLILYSLIKPTDYLTQAFVNPSFSLLFIVLINIYTLKAFSGGGADKRNQAFILACFFVGLAIQIHFSSIVYIFALIALQIFAKKLKIFSINSKKFYLGFMVFGLTLLPYFLWLGLKKSGIVLGQPLPYVGMVANSLPSLLAHFKITLEIATGEFLLLAFKKLFLVVPLAFVILQLIFYRKKEEAAGVGSTVIDHASLIKVFNVCLIFTFLPFSFYFFVPQGLRYAAPFTITISFMAIVLYSQLLKTKDKLKYFNLISLAVLIGACVFIYFLNLATQKGRATKALIFFLVLLLIAFFYHRRHQKNNVAMLMSFVLFGGLALSQFFIQNYFLNTIHSEGPMPRYWHWKQIWSKIYNDTGWSYSEAIKRIYFINHQREQAPKRAYSLFTKKNSKNKPHLSILPDGYFVSIDKPPETKVFDWIIKQPIQEEVRRGLLTGDIVIGDYTSKNSVLIAPYFVINHKTLPAYFHNVGWGYNKLPEENLFHDFEKSIGVKKISDNQYLFKWNECPDKHRYCDTGAIVSVTTVLPNVYKFDIKVVGLPLSQSSRWISPAWTQAWIEPYLEIKCGRSSTIMKIASSIGYNRKYLGFDPNFKYAMSNNSILAPFERSFEVLCKGLLSEISIGRKSAVVEQVIDFINLPEQKITIQLL